MLIKLLKDWRDKKAGSMVDVSTNRAGLLIRSGIATVSEPLKKETPVIETATVEPQAESAEVTPKRGRPKKQE